VDLSFKAFADATNASWFYIDDVAMAVRCSADAQRGVLGLI